METTILVLGFSGGIYRGIYLDNRKEMELTILVLGLRITFFGVLLGLYLEIGKEKWKLLFGF